MWVITEMNLVLNLDNVKTIKCEEVRDGDPWLVIAYLMDDSEEKIHHVDSEADGLDFIRELVGSDNISMDIGI